MVPGSGMSCNPPHSEVLTILLAQNVQERHAQEPCSVGEMVHLFRLLLTSAVPDN